MWVEFVPKLDQIHLISFAHRLDSEEEALCIDQQYLKVHHFLSGKNSKGIQDKLSEEIFVHLRCQPSPVWTKILNY